MMEGFLLAYAVITAPLIGWGFFRSWRKNNPSHYVSKVEQTELEKIVTEAFGKQGIPVKVHEIPKTPTEAIMLCTQEVLTAIRDGGRLSVAWMTELRNKADVNKRDMDAMLQTTQSMARMLLEIKDANEKKTPDSPGTIETYVRNLEYARDKFAETPAQKKLVEAIITSIKMNHGTRK